MMMWKEIITEYNGDMSLMNDYVLWIHAEGRNINLLLELTNNDSDNSNSGTGSGNTS